MRSGAPSWPRPRRSPAAPRDRVRARRGTPPVRRARVAPLARRRPPRALARADAAPRVPRRRPHRRAGHRRTLRARGRDHPRGHRRRSRRGPRLHPGLARRTSGTPASRASVHAASSSPATSSCSTESGRAQRQWIEDATDAAAVAAYVPLGDDGCARLRALARPWSRAIIDSGLLDAAGLILAQSVTTPGSDRPGAPPGSSARPRDASPGRATPSCDGRPRRASAAARRAR